MADPYKTGQSAPNIFGSPSIPPSEALAELLMNQNIVPRAPNNEAMVRALLGDQNVMTEMAMPDRGMPMLDRFSVQPQSFGEAVSLAMAGMPGGPKLPRGLGTFAPTVDIAKSAGNLFHGVGGNFDKAIMIATRREGAASPVVAQLQAWKDSGFTPKAPNTTASAARLAKDDAALAAQDAASEAASVPVADPNARLDWSVFDAVRRRKE